MQNKSLRAPGRGYFVIGMTMGFAMILIIMAIALANQPNPNMMIHQTPKATVQH